MQLFSKFTLLKMFSMHLRVVNIKLFQSEVVVVIYRTPPPQATEWDTLKINSILSAQKY